MAGSSGRERRPYPSVLARGRPDPAGGPGNERAGYGDEIYATLSRESAVEFGRGFEATNLRRMVQFAEAFPDEGIVATLSRELSWSHFKELLPLTRPLQREFYAEMSRVEGWSVRTLRGRNDSML